uniref:Uncharacterized protein n=1 Tax=Anguilla anguilla TaxID=7936 RepID=A0A0E9Q6F3_ANGAN
MQHMILATTTKKRNRSKMILGNKKATVRQCWFTD